MSTSLWAVENDRVGLRARLRDWMDLTKPRLTLLVLVTVVVGAVMGSSGYLELSTLVHLVVGTALIAASSSAANQTLERDRDRRMLRTADRPLPQGRMAVRDVVVFSAVALVAGAAYLALAVNVTVALLGLATWVTYVAIYTPMKTRTTANTVVGAVAGALPIMMGWAATGWQFDLFAISLFGIVYLWQFPHFMAIAWIYRDDYRRAGYRMLPLADERGQRAGAMASFAAASLLSVSLLPAVVGSAGFAYVLWALVLGFMYFAAALRFRLATNDETARTLLRASLIYLPALLIWLSLSP